MIDRIWLGYVVDFIDFTLIDFAVFNIADSFICVGAGLMMLDLVLDMIETGKEVKRENEEKARAKTAEAKTETEETPCENEAINNDTDSNVD